MRSHNTLLGQGFDMGNGYMQRHLYGGLSLVIAFLGLLLVAAPRFFLPLPVPVGIVAQNIHLIRPLR
jgi:hypothetical protein